MPDIARWTIKNRRGSASGFRYGIDGVPEDQWIPVAVVKADDYDVLAQQHAGAVASVEAILTHARLDVSERGIAEAERYVGLAEDALTHLRGQ